MPASIPDSRDAVVDQADPAPALRELPTWRTGGCGHRGVLYLSFQDWLGEGWLGRWAKGSLLKERLVSSFC